MAVVCAVIVVSYIAIRAEKSAPYDWYGVAPQGHYTAWTGVRPETLDGAQLTDRFELTQFDHIIRTQELEEEDWPYLTFKTKSFSRHARWVDEADFWRGSYTVHAADPQVSVPGVVPREPWFNTTIAVSHRWLDRYHPDPEGAQFAELMALSEKLGLVDSQAFLLDYCSLPQTPRTPDEAAWFRDNLPGFQAGTDLSAYSRCGPTGFAWLIDMVEGSPRAVRARPLARPLPSARTMRGVSALGLLI
jgi:hypothetical protein